MSNLVDLFAEFFVGFAKGIHHRDCGMRHASR